MIYHVVDMTRYYLTHSKLQLAAVGPFLALPRLFPISSPPSAGRRSPASGWSSPPPPSPSPRRAAPPRPSRARVTLPNVFRTLLSRKHLWKMWQLACTHLVMGQRARVPRGLLRPATRGRGGGGGGQEAEYAGALSLSLSLPLSLLGGPYFSVYLAPRSATHHAIHLSGWLLVSGHVGSNHVLRVT
jgi:hypothetical protein